MITVPGRNVTYRLIRLDTSGKHKHWQWQQQNCSYLFYALGSRLTRKTTKLFTRESASDGLTVSAPAAYIITLILLPDKYQEIYSFNTFSSKWNLESCSRFPWASCSMMIQCTVGKSLQKKAWSVWRNFHFLPHILISDYLSWLEFKKTFISSTKL